MKRGWVNTKQFGETGHLGKQRKFQWQGDICAGAWMTQRRYLMNCIQSFSKREQWALKSTELKKSMIHVLRAEGKVLSLKFPEHVGLGLRVTHRLDPVGIQYTYFLLCNPLWILWILITYLLFCDSQKQCILYWTEPSIFTWSKS